MSQSRAQVDLPNSKKLEELAAAIQAANSQKCAELLRSIRGPLTQFQQFLTPIIGESLFEKEVKTMVKIACDPLELKWVEKSSDSEPEKEKPFWEFRESIDDVINTIKVLQRHLINVDLSFITSGFFCRLLFMHPKIAYQLLNNTKTNTYSAFSLSFKQYALIAFPDYANHQDFLACINLLSKKENVVSDPYGYAASINDLIEFCFLTLAQKNYPYPLTLPTGIHFKDTFFDDFLDRILSWDSVDTLLANKQWIIDQLNNKTNLQSAENILKKAADLGAPRCIKILLQIYDNTNIDFINQLAKTAANKGDGVMVLALCNGDLDKAAEFFKSEFMAEVDDLKKPLLKMLRFTPFKLVGDIMLVLLERASENLALVAAYQQAKKEFYAVAPFFARLKREKDLNELSSNYNNQTNDDMAFGKNRLDFSTNLHKLLSNGQLTRPTTVQFQELPSGPKYATKKVAALLEAVAEWNFNIQKNPVFGLLRDEGYSTQVNGRYEWAIPLIVCTFYYSQAENIHRYSSYSYYNLSYKTDNKDKLILNSVGKTIFYDKISWNHGRAPISETWGIIEDLFERAWSMDLKPSIEGKNEDYENKLTEFYSIVAELVWLVGNTQALRRGTGTFNELILTLLHMKHELQPPILKLEFPQLDVLNITFALDDYKEGIFLFLFEPDTIPKHLRREIDPSMSLFDQMKELYREINESKLKNVQNTQNNNESKALSTQNSSNPHPSSRANRN